MIKLVCEVCYNHGGNVDRAIEIIDAFSDSCDIFKFQKMHPKTFLKKRYFEKNKNTVDYRGKTYGEHRDSLELSVEEHEYVRDYCQSIGKEYACTAHDLPSAKAIIPLMPSYIKIASCNCNNWKLIDYCLQHFPGFLHISTGMTTRKERQAVRTYSNQIIPYSCTSCYSGECDVYIERLPGFSCHIPDIIYAMAAIMNGAQYIEYHCTVDRDIKGVGSDPKISLLPEDYMELAAWIENNRKNIRRMKFEKPVGVPEYEKTARGKVWSTA
jgi:N-acetylneuraminate synthase